MGWNSTGSQALAGAECHRKVEAVVSALCEHHAGCRVSIAALVDAGCAGAAIETMYILPTEPFHPVDPCNFFRGGIGAWAIGARVSRLQYGDQIFDVFNVGPEKNPPQLANPVGNSDDATEVAPGTNWYWNRYFKIRFN
jgi:hypothetical protein